MSNDERRPSETARKALTLCVFNRRTNGTHWCTNHHPRQEVQGRLFSAKRTVKRRRRCQSRAARTPLPCRGCYSRSHNEDSPRQTRGPPRGRAFAPDDKSCRHGAVRTATKGGGGKTSERFLFLCLDQSATRAKDKVGYVSRLFSVPRVVVVLFFSGDAIISRCSSSKKRRRHKARRDRRSGLGQDASEVYIVLSL